jgi:hypothetical protein
MTETTDIHVVAGSVRAVLVGGDWWNVTDAVVSFADFTRAGADGPTVTAVGLYLAVTIQGGPQNGKRMVTPWRAVDAVRMA